jgi:hypothetical protein
MRKGQSLDNEQRRRGGAGVVVSEMVNGEWLTVNG